jgi:hypothetical protein
MAQSFHACFRGTAKVYKKAGEARRDEQAKVKEKLKKKD